VKLISTGGSGGCSAGSALRTRNQYDLLADKGGTYIMCAENGACGKIDVER